MRATTKKTTTKKQAKKPTSRTTAEKAASVPQERPERGGTVEWQALAWEARREALVAAFHLSDALFRCIGENIRALHDKRPPEPPLWQTLAADPKALDLAALVRVLGPSAPYGLQRFAEAFARFPVLLRNFDEGDLSDELIDLAREFHEVKPLAVAGLDALVEESKGEAAALKERIATGEALIARIDAEERARLAERKAADLDGIKADIADIKQNTAEHNAALAEHDKAEAERQYTTLREVRKFRAKVAKETHPDPDHLLAACREMDARRKAGKGTVPECAGEVLRFGREVGWQLGGMGEEGFLSYWYLYARKGGRKPGFTGADMARIIKESNAEKNAKKREGRAKEQEEARE